MRIEKNIVYGPPGEKNIPNVSMGQYIFDNLRVNTSRIYLVDTDSGESYTGKDILDNSIRVAKILEAYGVKPGDRISIVSENHPLYLVVTCGILYASGITVPLNPVYTEREYRHMLDIFHPNVIFVSTRTEKIIAQIVPTLDWKIKIIQLDDKSVTKDVPTLNELAKKYANTIDINTFVPKPITDSSREVAIILCSSGTTGLPKGVALSHRNLLTWIFNSNKPGFLEMREGDHLVLFLPFFHGYAMGLIMKGLCDNVVLYMMRAFNIDALLNIIQKYKITMLPVVPPILVALAKHPDLEKYDFSSLKQLTCGAAAFPLDVAKEVQKRMKLNVIRNGYGMTELSIVTNVSETNKECTGGVGIPFPDLLCKVVDQNTGEALGPRQIGEVCYKGDQVMLGYFANPKATDETIDKDKWLHTGDLGYYDEAGVLYITGRIKELIKYKGYQVSPSEIETVIQTHPGVKDAAVIGKPDKESGEVPLAFVVKQPNSNVTAKDIIDFTNGQLSRQKWLRGGVRFIDAIPKTPSGKIIRKQLIALTSKL